MVPQPYELTHQGKQSDFKGGDPAAFQRDPPQSQ